MARNNLRPEQQMGSEIIDLEDDDSNYSDFTLPDETISVDEFSIPSVALTGPDQTGNLRQLSPFQHGDILLHVDDTVELDDGDFLLIRQIRQRQITNATFLEGHLFKRTWKLQGLLEKKKNETVWIQRYDPNMAGDIYRQSLQQVQLRQVIRLRDMVLTNHIYPTGSYRDNLTSRRLDHAEILRSCRLACRWKYLAYGDKEGRLLALDQTEADPWYHVTDERLKHTWRGESMILGSCEDWLPGEKEFEEKEQNRCNNIDPFDFRQQTDPLDETKTWNPLNGSGKRYTFGDGFCGAGGVSRGAKAAGLRVHWSFDFDKAAIESYQKNFHETMCWHCSADIFVALEEELKVDVLHLSFPCQPFSPAHTRPGRNDDANEASFFSLEAILKKARPRVLMVEETFGLLRTEDRVRWFPAMIQTFTKLGYSVRWKIFNFLDFGLPGRRLRLMVYGSW